MAASAGISTRGGVRWPRLHHRSFSAGWLGVVASGRETSAVALADDVPEGDVAAAIRHLMIEHAEPGRVTACMPACGAAELFRPGDESKAVASSA